MLAILILIVITGLLVYYMVFTQGLFSCLIMSVLCVTSAVVALNYYEPLAAILIKWGLSTFGPKTGSLLVLFSLTLYVLREITDRFIRGNMKFPTWIDRSGSFFFATISSLTIVGMVSLGIQMLPVKAVVMGFDRCPDLNNPDNDKSLYPRADEFILGIFSHSSLYTFNGKNSFKQIHPDFLRELYINRVTPTDHEGSRNEAASDALEISKENLEVLKVPVVDSAGQKVDVSPDEILLMIPVTVRAGANDNEDRGAADVDRAIRFALADFRMIGYPSDNRKAPGISKYPIGVIDKNGNRVDALPWETGYHFTTSQANINVVFAWPRDLKKNPPVFIEFKHTARADMPTVKDLEKLIEP